MNATDPASLQNLNDIVLPEPIGWWPLAHGWYILAGLLLVILVMVFYRSARRWHTNRYRRAAEQELRLLSAAIQNPSECDSSLRQIPFLLKRVALSAYPRTDVAILSGADWYRFLNATTSKPVFPKSVCDTLEEIAYSRRDLAEVSGEPAKTLIAACEYWVKHHLASNMLKSARES